MPDFASLIDRVRSGSGADRGIDGEVALIVGWKFHFGSKQYDPEWPDMGGHWLPPDIDADVFKCTCRSDRHFDVPPAYTSSLDAVVRLVEEKLPDSLVDVYGTYRDWNAQVAPEPVARGYFVQDVDSAARALLAALLLALQAQEAA